MTYGKNRANACLVCFLDCCDFGAPCRHTWYETVIAGGHIRS